MEKIRYGRPERHTPVFRLRSNQRERALAEYLRYFPAPFLEDLVQGRCLPFIGAGFSRNGDLPPGQQMPAWDALGRSIAAALPDYEYTNALEGLSAYAHEFSRVKLVEAISTQLHTTTIQPGRAHEEFCHIPFDRLVTTNWDFLLEEAYTRIRRYCMPLLSEDQLSLSHSSAHVKLLKLHGDLHHPGRMVVTEDDYDGFLATYPLLSTYLSSLLIDNTAFFIGYSLEDPDFRQVWHIVKDRLGTLRRPAYLLQVDARSHERARFERRGVKVISLPRSANRSYAETLATAFRELREYWTEGLLSLSTATEPEPQAELELPTDAQSRLAFFSVPTRHAALYKEYVYPIAERWGFTPVMAVDVVAPGDNLVAKIYALMEKSAVILFDVSSPNVAFEAGLAADKGSAVTPQRIFVAEAGSNVPFDVRAARLLHRPGVTEGSDWHSFLSELNGSFAAAFEMISPRLDDEPNRLLRQGEYRAAVLAAMSLLEHQLRRLVLMAEPEMRRRPTSLGQMLQAPVVRDALAELAERVLMHNRLRNGIAHDNKRVSGRTAAAVVADVGAAVERVRRVLTD